MWDVLCPGIGPPGYDLRLPAHFVNNIQKDLIQGITILIYPKTRYSFTSLLFKFYDRPQNNNNRPQYTHAVSPTASGPYTLLDITNVLFDHPVHWPMFFILFSLFLNLTFF